jgi:hypothetical protein
VDARKIAIISASLGGFDEKVSHEIQTTPYDSYHYTDENFPPRAKAMTPRLQAKIPKMFGWQLAPGYDCYLWLDGNLRMNDPNLLKYLLEQIQGYDIVVVKHHRRNTLKWEARYMERALNEQSIYMVNRYDGEFWKEQQEAMKDYEDKALYIGGIFMYRNNAKVREAMKEWWYQVSRYCIQDQTSFPYAIRNLKIKVLDQDYTKWEMIKRERHNHK